MKTRSQIYGKEAAGLLRAVSLYPGLSSEQLCRFYPGKEETMQSVLTQMEKQGRIMQAKNGGWFVYGTDTTIVDAGTCRAVWVLLDFIDQADFHSSTDFPINIIFFAQGEVYEIIDIPAGQETIITQALCQIREEPGRRLVIVDSPEQIPALEISGVSAFCTVSAAGNVSYYQKQEAM